MHEYFYDDTCNGVDTIFGQGIQQNIFFLLCHLFFHVVELLWICLNRQKLYIESFGNCAPNIRQI